jgi:signal transduction histidine kinase
VRVAITQENSHGYITIGDKGSGFDLNQINQENGTYFGLVFMRERMTQIGGSLNIKSGQGAGKIIKLEAPVRSQPEENI